MDANISLAAQLGELFSQLDEGLAAYIDKGAEVPLPPRDTVAAAAETLDKLGHLPAGRQLLGQFDELAGEDELTQGFAQFVNSASLVANGDEARQALAKRAELLVGGALALRALIEGLRSGQVIVDEQGRVISLAPRVYAGDCGDGWCDDDPLQAIADRLLPLVQGRVEWWRDGVRRWANDPPHHVDDEGVDAGVLPIPFPNRAFTADERLALLAAIHDTYAEGVELVDPWRELRLLTPQEIGEQGRLHDYLKDLRYRALLDDRVPALRQEWEDHAAKIELFVAEIEVRFSTTSGHRTDESRGCDDRTSRADADLSPQDKAIALLVRNPGWTDTQIACAVGVSRTTLYKPTWKVYQNAREALRSGRDELPSGSKDGKTGRVEAWDEGGRDEEDDEEDDEENS